MAMWKYTIEGGTALREAIEDGDTKEAVKCLIECYKELMKKMSNEDMAYYEYSIMDTIDTLKWYIIFPEEDDEEHIDYYLAEFYDICDSVRAFVSL